METRRPANYSRIGLKTAQALTVEGAREFALYLPGMGDEDPVLFRKEGAGLSQPDFHRLRENDVQCLYVQSEDLRECETFFESKLSDLLTRNDVSPDEKAELVQRVGTSIARDMSADPMSSRNIGRAACVVETVIESVLNDSGIAKHLLRMVGHERSTASHMFMVSTLAVLLGVEVYGSDHHVLRSLGLAGMMHDIGKLGISPGVLNKPTPLTPKETRLIQRHPIESVRMLGDDPNVTPAARQFILQHHERIDGRGYPAGVCGNELHLGSRILSVVDSFHAMIGQRSYRMPLTSREANSVLNGHGGTQFDSYVLACWNELYERSGSADRAFHLDDPTGAPMQMCSRTEEGLESNGMKIYGARPQRFPCDSRVAVECTYAGRLHNVTCSSDEFKASVHDISRSGMCIHNEHPMYPGEVVNVRIATPGLQVWVRGVVAWCRYQEGERYKVGLRWDERISEDDADTKMTVGAIVQEEPEQPAVAAQHPATKSNVDESCSAPMTAEDALASLDEISRMRSVTADAEETAIALATSPHVEVRCRVIDILTEIGTRPAWNTVVALLGDSDPSVRNRATARTGVTLVGVSEPHA